MATQLKAKIIKMLHQKNGKRTSFYENPTTQEIKGVLVIVRDSFKSDELIDHILIVIKKS